MGVVGIVFKVFIGEWMWVGIDHQHQAGGTARQTGVQVFKGEWVWVGIDCCNQT